MGVREIEVFEDTVDKSVFKYADETHKMKDETKVYIQPINDLLFMPHPIMPNKDMKISVVNGGTVSEGAKLAKSGRTAILNFADALVPGGLVLSGETTQEENICRCSNLYQSLTMENARTQYYEVNEKMVKAQGRSEYTDNLIYSRGVLFFKDDTTYDDVEPYYMDVITCPAPSCKLAPNREYDTIYNRVLKIVKSAALNRVENVVFGAWGCGAFGQNPYVVATCFRDILSKYNAFNNVVFAIRSCDADTDKVTNLRAFKQVFDSISK